MVSTTDQLATFRFNQQSTVIPKAPPGQVFHGDKGIPRGMAKTDANNFSPRIGVAFDPTGKGRTAIRAGYGVFYAISFANVTSNLQGQPFLVDVTVFGTPNLVDPWSDVPGGSPFPYKLDLANPRFSLPLTTNYYDENAVTPYVQHYSLTAEHQVTSTLTVQGAYVGNTSHKLFFQRDANAPIYKPGSSTAGNINARRPYLPGVFAQIAHTNTGSNAHYDSLQLSFRQRMARGFTINGAGPGAAIWNLSAFKNFEIRERSRLQFRSEFFGAFNHPNFANPNGALNNANFGRILGAGGARVVQFALKYMF